MSPLLSTKRLCLSFRFLLAAIASASPVAGQEATPDVVKRLKYRLVGPAAGGRVCRVAGVPGDALIYFAATASGGVWKSAETGQDQSRSCGVSCPVV